MIAVLVRFTLPMEQALSTSPNLWCFSFCFPYFYFLGCFSSLTIYISLSFTPILNPIFSTNCSHHRLFFLSSGLTPCFPTASGTSEIFCFRFWFLPLSFLFMAQCGRLSWLLSFWVHYRYIIIVSKGQRGQGHRVIRCTVCVDLHYIQLHASTGCWGCM